MIREIMIAKGYNEDPPSDFENDIEDEEDIEFFLRCDKIEYDEGVIKIVESYSDENDEELLEYLEAE